MIVTFDLDQIGLFKPATELDISVGNVVYLIGDGNIMWRKVIDEVLRPSDPYKAFCATDGCRYGLEDLYVLSPINNKDKKIKKFKNTCNNCGETFQSTVKDFKMCPSCYI